MSLFDKNIVTIDEINAKVALGGQLNEGERQVVAQGLEDKINSLKENPTETGVSVIKVLNERLLKLRGGPIVSIKKD